MKGRPCRLAVTETSHHVEGPRLLYIAQRWLPLALHIRRECAGASSLLIARFPRRAAWHHSYNQIPPHLLPLCSCRTVQCSVAAQPTARHASCLPGAPAFLAEARSLVLGCYPASVHQSFKSLNGMLQRSTQTVFQDIQQGFIGMGTAVEWACLGGLEGVVGLGRLSFARIIVQATHDWVVRMWGGAQHSLDLRCAAVSRSSGVS